MVPRGTIDNIHISNRNINFIDVKILGKKKQPLYSNPDL